MKYLIAYYSWSGHTKMTAERIARVTGGNLFEIVPTEPYPRLYARCAIAAKAERDKNARPALIGTVENFDDYTDVIIGYPAWWHTCPQKGTPVQHPHGESFGRHRADPRALQGRGHREQGR